MSTLLSREVIIRRATQSLLASFAGDALAMPVHWFYDANDIYNAFGDSGVTRMEAPPAKHPYTFMKPPQPEEDLGGKRLIGDVIHKSAAARWGPENQHVHVGMPAGENTLNSYCARWLLQLYGNDPSIRQNGYSPEAWLKLYIDHMTSDTAHHPDTYAEGYHRNFFTKYTQGKDPLKNECGDTSQGAVSVGGLVVIIPLALAEFVRGDRKTEGSASWTLQDIPRVQAICRRHLFLTAPQEPIGVACDGLVSLVGTLLFRPEDASAEATLDALKKTATETAGNTDLSEWLKTGAEGKKGPRQTGDEAVMGKMGQLACAIESSWPRVLYLTAKYAVLERTPVEALFANANIGGENCHRGFVLGALIGLLNDQAGVDPNGLSSLTAQLLHFKELEKEIHAALTA